MMFLQSIHVVLMYHMKMTNIIPVLVQNQNKLITLNLQCREKKKRKIMKKKLKKSWQRKLNKMRWRLKLLKKHQYQNMKKNIVWLIIPLITQNLLRTDVHFIQYTIGQVLVLDDNDEQIIIFKKKLFKLIYSI